MYRVRRDIKQELSRLPDLRKHPILLRGNGADLDVRKVEWYRFVLNRKTLKVILYCKPKDGEPLEFPVPDLKKFVDSILHGIRLMEEKKITGRASSELPWPPETPANDPLPGSTPPPS
jgi:hypothetical protein